MTDRKQQLNKEDELVKSLFEDFSPSSPSDDFKKSTMDKVMLEWSSKPIYISTKISKQNKIWIGMAVAFSLLLVYIFDIKNITDGASIIGNIELKDTQNSFANSFESLSNTFAQIPALVYIITVGVSAIIFLDKMINKLNSKTI